ncbi:MAG TPA: glycosyltransferase family 39 protein [Phycisphaerae bacterium]|nr:glycosyltransferase family 39 protein [Phycisphaerae bacterium]
MIGRGAAVEPALGAPAGPAQPVPHLRAGVAAWLLALLGWTALLSFYDLDGGAGFEPTDCWVAQTAREMRHAGDWLTPRFSGEVRMQKSPGPYWAVMLTSIVRGTEVDEVSARIPNAIAAIVLVMTVFWLTLHVAGQRAAIFAGFATASSALILLWSHRAASDLGLAALCTLSLAALWIGSEIESPGPKRVALWMLGYFAAGLGMLYKMPMPLAAVGLPVLAYLLVRNRWRILASPWHLLGLLLFLLPWLPWALAVVHSQGMALAKWRVEFLDRYTGDLPNVEGQDSWAYLLFYLVPVAVYCLPFSLSIPAAVGRAFRRQPGVRRDGTLFMALWFFSLLVFFTASTGKELRYFLPALPPLFVLLGIELAALFDPQRQRSEVLVRLAAAAVLILLPVALIAGGIGLHRWWELRGRLELAELYQWRDVLWAYVGVALIMALGFGTAAWLYLRRRGNAAFGMIVATMWLMWLWAWPQFMPKLMSQRPFQAFAAELRERVPPALRADMYDIATHEPRITWYGDVRFPRIIDQLALLAEQGGRRDRDYEARRIGEEVITRLSGTQPLLLVARLEDYLKLLAVAPQELAAAGRTMPAHHLWLQTPYGDFKRHFVLFGNVPPPWPEPELKIPDGLPDQARQKIMSILAAAQPASAPAASRPSGPQPLPGGSD